MRRASASDDVYSESLPLASVCDESTKRRIDLPIVLTVVELLVEENPMPVASMATGFLKKLNSLRTALAICACGKPAPTAVSLSGSAALAGAAVPSVTVLDAPMFRGAQNPLIESLLAALP